MRKLSAAFTAFILAAAVLCSAAFAQNYTYFDIVNTNYPEDSISSDNIVCVGGVYYMSQKDGSLFYSHDARSWHCIDGSYGAKIVSDRKTVSDFLTVFYNGNLAKSYDGANFTLLKKFSPDTVIHCDNGLYVAYEKGGENGSSLYYSLDAQNWELVSSSLSDGRFAIDRYSGLFILNGINTADGTVCCVIVSGQTHILPYDRIDYDAQNGTYIFLKNGAGTKGAEISYASAPEAEKTKISPPDNTSNFELSFCGGTYYAAVSDSGSFTDIYKCSANSSWEWADTYYSPVYKTLDNNGNPREMYSWRSISKNTSGAFIKTPSGSSSIILPDGVTLGRYGSVIGTAAGGKAANLLTYDGISWHQCNDASAFSILNMHSLRGDYMFVDRTYDHNIFKPKGNPYENIESQGAEVRIDGHYVAFDQPPVIVNDRTLVPLRAISEALGAYVTYEPSSKLITLKKGGNTITTTVGSDTAHIEYYDGASYDAHLDSPSVIVSDRTLVPIRFIGETFGMNIGWESGNKTVWITSK